MQQCSLHTQLHQSNPQINSLTEDSNLLIVTVNEKMIMGFTKYLLGRSSTGVLPGKQDIANSCPVAVDAQKSEGEGNLGHPRASSLNQEVYKNQTESSEQGENCPVFRTRKTQQTNS